MEDIFHTLFTQVLKNAMCVALTIMTLYRLEQNESDLENEVDHDLREHDIAHTMAISKYACHQVYSSCPISLLHYALW
jgi:hypothetical protein